MFFGSLPNKKTLFRESVLTFRFFVEAQAISYSFFSCFFRANVVDTKLVCVLRSELTGREVVSYNKKLSALLFKSCHQQKPCQPQRNFN